MIRIPDIVTALQPLVGWRQSYNPAEAIDTELLQSESGLFFQDAHPLMTLNNVAAIMPDDFIFQYPEWDKDSEFPAGVKVRYDNKVYISLM